MSWCWSSAILSSALALGACASDPPAAPTARGWWQRTAATHEGRVNGCAVGDLDPAREGNEVALVAGDGWVLSLARTEGAWDLTTLGWLPGEPIQCALGDLVPDWPGDELVTVGMASGPESDFGAGRAILWRRDGGLWKPLEVLLDDALLHAVAIGDVDPGQPGNELVVAGFSGVAHVGSGFAALATGGQPEWSSAPIVAPEAHAKGAAIGPHGALLACDDGSLLALRRADGGWTTSVVEAWPGAGLARIAASGSGVLIGANDGVLRYRDEAEGDPTRVVTTMLPLSADRLRGAVLADLDPEVPGPEWASAGYEGSVWVVEARPATDRHDFFVGADGPRAHEVQKRVVAHDDDKLHHLAAGTLPGLGTCLVAVGYSGRILVVGSGPPPAEPEEDR